MSRRAVALLVAVASLVGWPGVVLAEDPPPPLRGDALPEGWTVSRVVRVPAADLAGFSERLGARIVALENVFLDANGFPGQVNRIVTDDEAGARTVEERLVALRGADFVGRRQRDVFEVAGTNLLFARVAREALGIPAARTAKWEVRFRAALVDEVVESRRNQAFELFLRRERRVDDAAVESALRQALEGWRFGNSLVLVAPTSGPGRATWSFTPEPTTRARKGDLLRVTFEDAPTVLGVPYVDVVGRLEVPSRWRGTPAPAPEPPETEPTPYWPVTSVQETARGLVAGVEGDRARVLKVLRWLAGSVAYGGATGSRDPVSEVLERGYGRCFDKSDVLITACRSLGLSARVVAGWVPALRAGHVWTEIRLAEEGWVPVDATTAWIGTSVDYLPFFRSAEGPLPFLYLGWPEIRRLD